MSEKTSIEYAHFTWSPWLGCTKVAAGCENCYAEELMDKRYHKVRWGPLGTRVKTSDSYWRNPLGWNKHAAAGRCPICKGRGHIGVLADDKQSHYCCPQCHGKCEGPPYRPRVFPSLCDPFEDWQGPMMDSKGIVVTDDGKPATMNDIRRDFFDLIDATPQLDWLLFTKRPENIGFMRGETYRENVWLIYSASTMSDLDRGMPYLLACRNLCPVIGLSLEPLLGPIDLEAWDDIGWVVVGGESGPRHRPCEVDWINELEWQCYIKEIPCFVKQDCGEKPGQQGRIPDDVLASKQLPQRSNP